MNLKNKPYHVRMLNINLFSSGVNRILVVIALTVILVGCGVSVKYSMTGTSTPAQSITITEFYNNSDLGPANMGQTLTNELKNYFIQNSNISVVQEEGELILEGEVTGFSITNIAPVSTGNEADFTQASSSRLTITVRATYINTLDDKMSFKDKTFSFYQDFPADQNISEVQDQYTRVIFDQIINQIFNASVANW